MMITSSFWRISFSSIFKSIEVDFFKIFATIVSITLIAIWKKCKEKQNPS